MGSHTRSAAGPRRSPRAITKSNSFGDAWVVGNWPTTGENARGGLTMRDGDSNPEAIIIGTPMDGTSNPSTTKVGDTLADITGGVSSGYNPLYCFRSLTRI